MRQRRISRRAFLVAAGPAVAGAGIAGWRLTRRQPLYLSAHHSRDELPHVGAFDSRGHLCLRLPIDLRAHASAAHPLRPDTAVFISRRPGNLLHEIDLREGAVRRVVRAAANRHFYGHGVYRPDCRYLFTTENDFENGVGVVGVREAESHALIREMPSHGVGPHELAFLGDGRTLVIANGGIQTHPDAPREKLNLSTMAPSLAYVDAASGALQATHILDNPFLSIRHLAVGRDDLIAVALQHEGPQEDSPPLVGFQRGDGPIVLAEAPEALLRRLNHYTGSICLHPDTGTVAVSCPRGGLVTFWDSGSARFLSSLPVRDAGGISLSADGECFVVTNGLGEIPSIRADTLELAAPPIIVADTMWDNHLALVPFT